MSIRNTYKPSFELVNSLINEFINSNKQIKKQIINPTFYQFEHLMYCDFKINVNKIKIQKKEINKNFTLESPPLLSQQTKIPIENHQITITQLYTLNIKEMKSNNVRQLMNLLSDKYFGNQLNNYPTNKTAKTQLKANIKNEDSTYSILSPVVGSKLSPKFNRTSSLSQIKKNQNINYFEESRTILQETKNMLNKPVNSFNKNDKKRLQIKQSLENEIGSDKKINNESYQYTYTRKYSHKDLSKNNGVDFSSYLSPAAFGANKSNKDLRASEVNLSSKNINGKQASKNANSRLVKQGIKQSKAINGKKLFLRETPSELNKLQSHSTVSNSQSTKYIEESDQKQYNTENPYISMTKKQKEQLQFYKQKCAFLEQENLGLKQKVSLYEQQFNEEKLMVDNLKNMISQREIQVNQIINNKFSAFDQKQSLLQNVQAENDALRTQLNNVRQLLREQQSIIIELYAKNKNKPLVLNELPIYQGVENMNRPSQNVKNTLTSLKSHCSSSSRNNNQKIPYVSSYLDSNARESIEESSFDDE